MDAENLISSLAQTVNQSENIWRAGLIATGIGIVEVMIFCKLMEIGKLNHKKALLLGAIALLSDAYLGVSGKPEQALGNFIGIIIALSILYFEEIENFCGPKTKK